MREYTGNVPKIRFIAVGGTIDKVYYDRKNRYQIGAPTLKGILKEANVCLEYDCESLLRKDSLNMTNEDRLLVLDTVQSGENKHVVITHGTDTMIETAKVLQRISDKTIVLTGAMQPARFKISDAAFNLGFAIAVVQTLPRGVYIAMHGQIFNPGRIRKNISISRFERIS